MGNLTQAEITWRKAETQRPQLTFALSFDVLQPGGAAAFLQMVRCLGEIAKKKFGGANNMNHSNNYLYDDEVPEIENEYLTPREVMNLLYIGKNTFYKLVNSGQLPAFRVGKLWRVRRDDIASYC